jgi:pimeloyl-ACP methyl ester carboxylesterase
MIPWCVATARRFCAASVELRLNPLTNLPSANLMAQSRSGRKRILPQKHTPPPGWKSPLAPQQPLASARWILGGLAATLLLAALCVYATFCLLFWQGQWQLVFKPSRTITATPSSVGLKYDEIRFDSTETGVLQLDGWWIPADRSPSTSTLLLLHDGAGSLSDTLPQLQALHQLGLNIFAFDYRGFGKSVNIHPSQASTYEDADAAWRYLTDTRHLSPSMIVLDGVRLGAAVAVETARRHPQAAALILEDPQPPTLDSLQFDARTRLLPISLLFHDRFDPTRTLASLSTPKLMLYSAHGANGLYYDQAAQPKQRATLAALFRDEGYLPCLRSFLGKYLPGS